MRSVLWVYVATYWVIVSQIRMWSYRHKLITANEAAFVASDDILRAVFGSWYKKLIDALLDRDFSSEGVRSIVEALRAVANLEAGIAVSRGLVPLSSDSGDAPGSVNVSRSNVIIVPMPDRCSGACSGYWR